MGASAGKRVLLLFWALWLGVIAATNLFSLLRAVQVIDQQWVFASNNFNLVRSFMSGYGAPHSWVVVAFSGVVVWQWLTVALFLRALSGAPDRKAENAAFSTGLALFAAFLVAGEFFLRFDYEAIHMRIVMAMIVSWLAMHVLPDN